VSLVHGTRFRMSYNGRQYAGEIVDGKWVIEGKTFDSPSGAASGVALTKSGKTLGSTDGVLGGSGPR
jgi:hypothetical protein